MKITLALALAFFIAGCGADQIPPPGPVTPPEFAPVAGHYLHTAHWNRLAYSNGDSAFGIYEISPTGMFSQRADSSLASAPSDLGQLRLERTSYVFTGRDGTRMSLDTVAGASLPSTLQIRGLHLVRVDSTFGRLAITRMTEAQTQLRSSLGTTAWRLKHIDVVETPAREPRFRVLAAALAAPRNHRIPLTRASDGTTSTLTLPERISFAVPYDVSAADANPLAPRVRTETQRVLGRDALEFPLVNIQTSLTYALSEMSRIGTQNWLALSIRTPLGNPTRGEYPSSVSERPVPFAISGIETTPAALLTLRFLGDAEERRQLITWLAAPGVGQIDFVYERL